MTRSVAIVGASKTTRHLAPYDDPSVDIWGFNEACAWDWFRNPAAMFQVHDKRVFSRANNHNDSNHWRWLQEDHPFPIYMFKTWPEIPASVRYPFDEVIEKVRPVRRFFTSTTPYMIALAIYQRMVGPGCDWLGIFGVDQAMGTEWAYQRDCTSYWIGRAEGAGIEVYLPDDCKLLKARLYGFEAAPMLSRSYFELRAEALDAKYEESLAKRNLASGTVMALANVLERATDEKEVERLEQDLHQAMIDERQALLKASELIGRREENRLYTKEYDDMILASGIANTEGDYSK